MFLTCQECETKYRLDPAKLGSGRMVRCTDCGNIWFQAPEQSVKPVSVASTDDMDLLQQIGIGAETQSSGEDAAPKNFREMLQESSGNIPDVVKPTSQGFSIPVMEYRPMGMAAGQLGMFVFLLFTFSTLIVLFLLRAPIVHTFPTMASLYQVMGFEVHVPGEGLRLSEMTAENRIDGEKKRLAVEARLTNISEHNMDQPRMTVSLKGPYGRVLQEWDYKPDSKNVLVSGESAPIKMEFDDMKSEGNSIEIKVAEE